MILQFSGWHDGFLEKSGKPPQHALLPGETFLEAVRILSLHSNESPMKKWGDLEKLHSLDLFYPLPDY